MTRDLFNQARAFFRTVGPSPDDEALEVSNCTICNPGHTAYRCKKCDFQSWEKWRMAIHLAVDTQHCNATANRRAREWANQ